MRRWGEPPGDPKHDAEALAAAWADPEVARWTAVPQDRSVAAAARWIAGEPERRARRLAVDLVVGGREVLGEVGLTRFDAEGRAELGFWLAPSARGRGLATAAVAHVTRRALTPRRTAPAPAVASAGQPAELLPRDDARGNGSSLARALPQACVPGWPASLVDVAALGLRRIWARTDRGNERAAHVLVRAGFVARGEAGGSMVWTADAASLRA